MTRGPEGIRMPAMAAAVEIAAISLAVGGAADDERGRLSMARRLNLILATIGTVAAAAIGTGAAAKPQHGDACFLSRNWEEWTAPGDGDYLLLRVGVHDFYRVDLAPGTHVHRGIDRFLVNIVRGSDWICSPLDLDLTLSDHLGFREPLIARSLRKLTPEEVAAIPRKDLP
jgi:hypothetical protein